VRPVETISGVAEGGIKNNDGGGKFNWFVVRTFENVTMYPMCHNNMIIKKFF
jgi:hypothetical protein